MPDPTLSSLDWDQFPPATRHRLAALLPEVDSFDELWARSTSADRRALERALDALDDDEPEDELHHGAWQVGPRARSPWGRVGDPGAPVPLPARPPSVRPVPALGAPEAEWRAWCRRFGLEEELDRPLAGRFDAVGYDVPAGLRLGALLAGAAPSPRHRGRPPLLERLLAHLLWQAEGRARLLGQRVERERARRPPPESLAAAWATVTGLRDRHFPGLCTVDASPPTHFDSEALTVQVTPTAVTLHLADGRLDGRCDLGDLEALLDWLGASTPARDGAARALAVPPWRRALDRLVSVTHLGHAPEGDEEDAPTLGFEVALHATGWVVHPVEARTGRRRGWSTRRVRPGQVPPRLRVDPKDDRVVRRLLEHRFAEALADLVGHPRVFLSGRGTKEPVLVRRGAPQLGVRRSESGDLRLTFDVDGAPVDLAQARALHGVLADTTAGGIRVALLPPPTAALFAMAAHLPTVPAADLGALLEALPGLAGSVPVAAGPGALGASLPGDERLLVALRWSDEALGVSLRVQPLPESPPTPPGDGAALVCTRRDGRVVHHLRDLASERARAVEQAEGLGLSPRDRVGPADWVVAEPQAALGVVERLRSAGGVRAQWEGERLAVHPADAADLKLWLSRGTDWFGVGGDLTVAGRRVDLAAIVRAAQAGHRYVALGEGHWAALDETLRARLGAIAGDGRAGALHAPLLAALVEEGAAVEGPPEWARLHERVREARDLEVPLPEGLQAELRPYQREGVEWLARLAHWAPGAILADDMGLGKTVQAIALLLRRAAEGPALVVAPTSVVGNWARELARFAPSLRVAIHGGAARAALLASLGPGDVLLCTYGVLVNDAGAFHAVRFGTAVLDEAQAVRNPVAQRSGVVHALDAGFRLALTGTPVENRTTDLWSLLRFAAPGLLGELPAFQKTFAEPVDAGGDVARRATLAALVAPFVLRRTKRAVAPELPPRTELELAVELGADERAAYERARLEAIERIANAGRRKAVQTLEELTRLRRQVCHPRLVDPTTPLGSAKVQRAAALLQELRGAGHRVLVFSTMLGLLELVRDAIAGQGFSWCWLDGSTPPKARQVEVDRFQQGGTDVFFVSTKAGGVGLNLTAADYVLHLDPWWNPAAEDQASDRAHRIGQTRPVTVLRLVARDTVEERIVALHAHKRELADALLAGAGSTALPDLAALSALLEDARGVR